MINMIIGAAIAIFAGLLCYGTQQLVEKAKLVRQKELANFAKDWRHSRDEFARARSDLAPWEQMARLPYAELDMFCQPEITIRFFGNAEIGPEKHYPIIACYEYRQRNVSVHYRFERDQAGRQPRWIIEIGIYDYNLNK
jgi:hypothetical protein